MLTLLIITAAFIWGFVTAADTHSTTESPVKVLSAKPIAISVAWAFGAGFVLFGFSIFGGIFLASVSAVGSYAAARLSDDNPIKRYFNLSRR